MQDQLLMRANAWRHEAYLAAAHARAKQSAANVSLSVLANVVTYALNPERFGLGPARNTATKYKRIWEEMLSDSDPLHKLVADAFDGYLAGDDSLYKSLMPNRDTWTLLEIGRLTEHVRFGQAKPPEWRARKFHAPLYLTASGILEAFPESDDDCFLDYEMAQLAVQRYEKAIPDGMSWRINITKRGRQIHPHAYRRWVKEVKNVDGYKEPRRSLSDSYSMYLDGGYAALRERYSPGYVFMLLRKFKQEGWKIHERQEPQS
jgi:hypothetical protein